MRWPHLLGPIALAFIVITGAGLSPAALAAEEEVALGKVTELKGRVEARRGGVLRNLALGAEVHEGDLLRSGPRSYVRVTHKDGSWVFVGADSAVAFSRHLLDPDGVGRQGILTLVLGILRTKLLGPPWREGYEVKTRAAVAAARGTEWIVESRPLKTAVYVIEGEVGVTAKQSRDRVLLGPGMGTEVPLNGLPNPPAAWSQERVADVEARTRAR